MPPAAAGQGRPTKKRLSARTVCTLKRARRVAQQTTK